MSHRHTEEKRKAASLATGQISSDLAMKIARVDAEKVYPDLTRFRIEISIEDDGWHVDYTLKNRHVNGGGPHYVIDAQSGAIISKRYEQ